MRVNKIPNGDYYLERMTTARRSRGYATYRDWWLVKHDSGNQGIISLGKSVALLLPKELIGKKIRLKVEIMGEENNNIYKPRIEEKSSLFKKILNKVKL